MQQQPEWVLIHGWGANNACWGVFETQLRTMGRVRAINLPGFGGRAFNESETSISAIATTLAAEIPDNAYVLGWSMGGMVASQLAHDYPQKVSKLVLVASNPKFIASEDWHGMPQINLNKFIDNLAYDRERTLKRFIALQFFGLPEEKSLMQQANSWIVNDTPADTRALQAGLSLLAEGDQRAVLKKLTQPRLALFGKNDAMVPAKLASDFDAMGIDTAVIDGAGHAPFLSHPNACVEIIKHWVENDEL